MSVDNGLRPLFRDHLKRGWHWTSVETGGTELGIPDSHYFRLLPGGRELSRWVEYKATDGWVVDLRREQVGWHAAAARHGGRSFVAVRRQASAGPRRGAAVDELWLLRGADSIAMKTGGLVLDAPYLLGRWQGGPGSWNWDVIGEILCAP